MRPHRSTLIAVLAASAGAVAAAAPAARADTAVATATDPDGLALRADAGSVGWLRPDGRDHTRFVTAAVASPKPQDVGPRMSGTPDFDMGRDARGRAVLLWADDCTRRSGRCVVRALRADGSEGAARVLTRIPYTGGAPTVALDGRRLVYTRQVRKGKQTCDTLNTRTLTGGARPARPRQLILGTGCVPILQLDVEGPWVATLVVPNDQFVTNSEPTEVLAVRADGRGRARKLELETQGEESNYVDAIAIDGGKVYTARAGIRQANAFLRIDPATGATSQALVFGALAGGFARDGGHPFFTQSSGHDYEEGCPVEEGECVLVAGQDPWAGTRTLLPRLTMKAAPAPLYVDDTLALSGTVTRQSATRTTRSAATGVAGVPLAIRTASLTDRGVGGFGPSGLAATTAADGTWSVSVPGPQVPGRGYDATSPVLGVLGGVGQFPTAWAHMAVTASSRSGGSVTLSGTIDPPQPGRKVVLQRRTARRCGQDARIYGSPSPHTVGQPAGCVDTFRALGSATVSDDGRTFTISRSANPGSFYVSLDAPKAGRLSGETAQVSVK